MQRTRTLELGGLAAGEGLAHVLVLIGAVAAIVAAVAEVGVLHEEVVRALELVLGAEASVVEAWRAPGLVRQVCRQLQVFKCPLCCL